MTKNTLSDRFVSLAPNAGDTVLAFDFELTRADGMLVIRKRGGVSTTLDLGDGYSFPDGLGTEVGGTLTLAAAVQDGDTYLLVGRLPEVRSSDFEASLAFKSAKFNADLDKLTLIAQEHRRDIDRAMKTPFGSAGKSVAILPEGHFHRSDADGNLVDGGSADDIASAQSHAAAAATSAGTAASAASAAVTAANRAADWAEKPEDVQVVAGQYSALHWAAKALAAAQAIIAGIAALIHSTTDKADLVDTDEFALVDSADGWSLKKVTWANIKARIASTAMTLTNKTLTAPTINGMALTGDITGSIKATGNVTAEAGIFTGRDDTVVLAAKDAGGTVVLRPNGSGTGTGQVIVDAAGKVTLGADPQIASDAATKRYVDREYVSDEQAITAGGPLTLAHDLGVEPGVITLELINKVAEHGYSVGDKVSVNLAVNTGAGNATNVQVINKTAYNIFLRFSFSSAKPFWLLHKTSGAPVNFTNESWRLIVRARP